MYNLFFLFRIYICLNLISCPDVHGAQFKNIVFEYTWQQLSLNKNIWKLLLKKYNLLSSYGENKLAYHFYDSSFRK